jgi:hypothetical protein
MRAPWVIVTAIIFAFPSCNRKEITHNTGASSTPTAATSKEPDALEGVATNFVPTAVLTESELQDLVKLAAKCGIERVSLIRTYYIHPSSNCGIEIKSAETISGRKVSFVTINIRYKDPYDDDRPGDVVASVGEFRVRTSRISKNSLTTFTTRSGTIRVRLAEDVPLATADEIVELFAKGRIRCMDETSIKEMQELDLSKPECLEYSKDDGKFLIGFAIGEYGSAWLSFTLEANEVTVSKVQKIIS